MPAASGVFKQLAYKAETTYGTDPGATGAQSLRRVQSTLDLTKDTYQSNEIRTDLQVADFRHGVRRVSGKISGELSTQTYADFFAAILKRDFTSGVNISGVSLTIAGAGPSYTVTRAVGSYLADGFKVGDIVRLSVGTLNAANINRNLLVVSLTALALTVVTLNGSALVAEGPITGCTVSVPGKKTFVPQSGHTDKSFAFEHYYSDLGQSELFTGCKVGKLSLALPPTGMSTIDMDVTGQNVTTSASRYYTSPTAQTTTGILAAVNGVCRIAGQPVANLTGLSFDVNAYFKGDPVVGSNVVPTQFPGRVTISGQATAYFDSVSLRDAFLNESEIDLIAALTADNSAASAAMSFALPRIKLGGSTKSDGEDGLVQTIPFTALLNIGGGAGLATELTTLTVQDTQA